MKAIARAHFKNADIEGNSCKTYTTIFEDDKKYFVIIQKLCLQSYPAETNGVIVKIFKDKALYQWEIGFRLETLNEIALNVNKFINEQ